MAEPNELALALRRREEWAVAELYDRYGRAVYALALRITRDPGMAEEVSLDAFMQLWRQADRLETGHGSVPSWLFTIARSRAIDRLRAAGAAKRTETDNAPSLGTAPQPEELAELAQRQHLVREAMAGLSPPQRLALELAYYEGLSHSQIASRLGEPLGTIKTRIRQAMTALRKALQPILSSTA